MSKCLHFLITIISSLIGISIESFDCDDYWVDGSYCEDDYTGYHVCTWTGEWGRRYRHEIVKCPTNTRCSCHHRDRCRMERSKICTAYTEAKPVADPAIFSFNGSKTVDYTSRRRQDDVTQLSGEIRQDRSKGKYMKIYKCNKRNKRYFDLAISVAGNRIKRFYGNYDDKKCRAWTTRYYRFKYVASDLHKYTLKKSRVDDAGVTHQEWYFKQGDYEGQYFDKFWHVSVDNGGASITPTKYIEKFLASEDNTHTSTKVLKWTTTTPSAGSNTDKWFSPPNFC